MRDSSARTKAFLKYTLSTIKSPAPLEVVVFYWDCDFAGVESRDSDWPHVCELSQGGREVEASQHREEFEVVREVHKVQAFRLVLPRKVTH